MRKFYFFLFIIFMPLFLLAQTPTTETFADETDGAVTFTDNGQVFNITSQLGSFSIFNNGQGLGWSGTANDNGFIDNSSGASIGQNIKFTVSTAGGVPFTLKSMWLYLTKPNLNPGSGTVTIEGVLSGASVFTVTTSLNLIPIPTANNGFTKLDLSTMGSSDNSNKTIDAFVISTTGDFGYSALDALSWAKVDLATPVALSGFNGSLQNHTAMLNWQTGVETGIDHYEVQKSVADNKYSTIESVSVKGSNSHYTFSVLQAEPRADYRLKIIGDDGHISYSRQVTLVGEGNGSVVIYPNPAHDYINVRVATATAVTIYDVSGRQIKRVKLQPGVNAVDISGLSQGVYYAKMDKEPKKISFVVQ